MEIKAFLPKIKAFLKKPKLFLTFTRKNGTPINLSQPLPIHNTLVICYCSLWHFAERRMHEANKFLNNVFELPPQKLSCRLRSSIRKLEFGSVRRKFLRPPPIPPARKTFKLHLKLILLLVSLIKCQSALCVPRSLVTEVLRQREKCLRERFVMWSWTVVAGGLHGIALRLV